MFIANTIIIIIWSDSEELIQFICLNAPKGLESVDLGFSQTLLLTWAA